jgi:AcrR family transcriptional regulator
MPRPPVPLLSEEVIVASTLRLVKEGGPDSFSMRRLATALNVTPHALYYYFPNKNALWRAVYAHMMRELPLPSGGTWAEKLECLARDFRDLCHRYREAVPYFRFMEEQTPPPPHMRSLELLARILQEAGLPGELLWPLIYSFLASLLGFIRGELEDPDPVEDARQMAKLACEQKGAYPVLAQLADNGHLRAEQLFDVHLRVLVAGLAALANADTSVPQNRESGTEPLRPDDP